MVDISRPSGRGRTWSGVIPTEGGIWSMSEANKGATTGGQDGPSDSGIPAIESIAQISSHLARVAVGRDGKLHANAEIQIALRDKDGRSKRSEEHTSELQSLMRISYAVFCLKKKK